VLLLTFRVLCGAVAVRYPVTRQNIPQDLKLQCHVFFHIRTVHPGIIKAFYSPTDLQVSFLKKEH
jgi:hypothetical protein